MGRETFNNKLSGAPCCLYQSVLKVSQVFWGLSCCLSNECIKIKFTTSWTSKLIWAKWSFARCLQVRTLIWRRNFDFYFSCYFRLCLFKSNILKSMFHCSIGSQTYADIYESCTGYSVIDNTQLPHRICNDCEEKLVSHHNFRLSIDDVEEKLQAFQMQFEQKIEKIHQDNDEDIYVIEQLYEEEEMLDEIETNDEEFYAPQDDSQDEDNAEQQYKFEKTEDLTCRFVISEQNSQNVKCKSCNAECPLEASINEIKSHVDFPITCECEKVFKNRRSFTRHYSIIHQKKESSYPCRDFNCTEVFRTWRSKVTHEANKHNIGLNFSCSSCEKKFYRRDHWKDHEKSCNKSVDSSDKFFSCAICLFTFQREDTFRKHLQTAHVGANEGDTEYSQRAEDYAQKYSKSRSVVVEAPAEESDKQSPTCKVCNKMFKNHISLSKHMSSFHSNQGWACDKCDAVFVRKYFKTFREFKLMLVFNIHRSINKAQSHVKGARQS